MNKRQRKKTAKAQTREMLDRRYDDLKSGRVKPVSWEEVEAYFQEKERRNK